MIDASAGRRARFAVAGFAASAAFVPGIFSMPSAPRWWAMAILLPICCAADPRSIPWPVAMGIAWAAAGAFFAPMPYEAAFDTFLLVLTALWLAGAASEPRGTEAALAGFGWGLGLSAGFAVAQQYAGFGWIPHGGPSGLFLNTEVYAEAAAPVLAWALWSARWHIAAFAAVPIALCHSRVGAAAVIVGSAWMLAPRWRWPLLVLLGAAGLASVFAFGEYKASTGMSRAVLWGMALMAMEPLGKGIGWWATTFTGRTLEYAHSDVLQILVELGIGAIPMLAFAALLLRDTKSAPRGEGAAFAAICFEALVSFPLHTPAGAFLFAVLAGGVARARPELRVESVSRGARVFRGLVRRQAAVCVGMVRGRAAHAPGVPVGPQRHHRDGEHRPRGSDTDRGAVMLAHEESR